MPNARSKAMGKTDSKAHQKSDKGIGISVTDVAGDEERIYGFDAFVPAQAKVLILGSMPSVKSLEQGFYYAHPQNRMFKLIARYLALRQTGTYDNAMPLNSVSERKDALNELGIAMWDTVDSCVRSGSLDSSIKAATYADIASLLRKHTSIRCVITAGGFSAKVFKKSTLSLPEVVSGELSFDYYALPSTSPANTVSFEKLCLAYDAAILPHLKL